MLLVPRLGFSLFPENDSPYFLVDIELPQGSAVSETDRAVLFADGVIAAEPHFDWRFANTGRGNPQIYYNVISGRAAVERRFDLRAVRPLGDGVGPRHARSLARKVEDVSRRAFQRTPLRQRSADRSADRRARTRPRHRRAGRDCGGRRADRARHAGTRDVSNPMAAAARRSRLNIDDAAARFARRPSRVRSIRRCASPSPVFLWRDFRDPVGDCLPCRAARAARRRNVGGRLERLYRVERRGRRIAARGTREPTIDNGPGVDRSLPTRAHGDGSRLHRVRLADVSAVTRDVARQLASAAHAAGLRIELRRRSRGARTQLRRTWCLRSWSPCSASWRFCCWSSGTSQSPRWSRS